MMMGTISRGRSFQVGFYGALGMLDAAISALISWLRPSTTPDERWPADQSPANTR